MLLEIILYFSLGFLVAILLVLLVAPSIWNRAVILTKKKVENSLPLSLNEIQAEKDKLRAEFAMTARRMELGIEELRNKAAQQVIELHSKRDEANRLSRDHKADLVKIDNLENAAGAMRNQLQENQDQIESLNTNLLSNIEELGELRTKHTELQAKHSLSEEELNRMRIELVASDNKVDTLSATLATLNLSDEGQAEKLKALHEQINQLKSQIKEEMNNSKISAMEAKVALRKLQTAENKLERLSGKSKGSRDIEAKLRHEIAELTNQLVSENAKVVDLEAKLAQNMLREFTEPAETAKSANGKLENLPDFSELKTQGETFTKDMRDAIQSGKMTAAQKRSLQKKLKDIAAKTATAVAASEGEGSVVTQLVRDNTPGKSSTDAGSLIQAIGKQQTAASSENS